VIVKLKKKNHKMMKKPNLSNKSLNKSIYFNSKLFVQSQNQFPHKTKKKTDKFGNL
jgi:hypothetical protein